MKPFHQDVPMICFRTCVINTQYSSLCAGRQGELDQENFVLDSGKIVFYSAGKAIHNIPEKKKNNPASTEAREKKYSENKFENDTFLKQIANW